MLGHKIIVQSQRLARLGLGNRSVLKEGLCGVSPLVTSDPQNQNKQARVWAGGILSANFKTSSTPDAPLANVKFIEEEEDPYDGLIEDLVAGEHEFEPDRSRELSQTVEYYQHTLPSDDVIDQSVPLTLNIQQNGLAASDSVPSSVHTTAMEQVESYDCRGSVSLHSVMQSMVPEPYQPSSTAPTHVNMPGGGHQMTLKYLNDRELHSHQSRHHSTSAAYRMQNRRNFSTYRILNASVFNDMQGVQGDIESLRKEVGGPSPQGIQGENDARFALWMKNCGQFGDCSEQLDAVRSGRKTLQQIFDEQDEQIRLAAEKLEVSMPEQSVSPGSPPHSTPNSGSGGEKPEQPPSQRERLKMAIRDYGSTVVVFHVGISIMSLAGFYALVQSGIDLVGIMEKLGVGQAFLESKLAAGTSTFVVAYAVHKVFAPVRIAITLTSTPFIVRYLRRVGILKVQKAVSK